MSKNLLPASPSVQPFEFDATTVRVVDIDGEPWFVAKDVCEALGYTNPQKAVRDHCKRANPVGVNETFTPSETPENRQSEGALDPQTVIIPESDIYRLIMRSRLPAAERFETWVVEQVLPSIRKTGAYGGHQYLNPAFQAIQDMIIQADKLEREQAEQRQRITKVEQKLTEFDGETGYRTVLAFIRESGGTLPLLDANALGRLASRLCREHGIRIGKVPDERFGFVNSYPVAILKILANKSPDAWDDIDDVIEQILGDDL